MAVELKLPELGENIESGRVVGIMVKAGEKIEKDQVLMELETDKAVVEVPAEESGIIDKVMVKEGDDVKIGQVLVTLGSNDKKEPSKKPQIEAPSSNETAETKKRKEDKSSTTEQKISDDDSGKKEQKSNSDAKQIVDFKIPELGENIESGSVANILVSVGDNIKPEQGLIELETDKAIAEVPSEIAGTIKEISIKQGDQVKVGQAVMKIETSSVDEKEPEQEQEQVQEAQSEPLQEIQQQTAPEKTEPEPILHYDKPRDPNALVPAAPSVRRFAREIGINIHEVPGSGPAGRISIEDIKRYSKSLNAQRKASQSVFKGFEAEALPDFTKWGKIDSQPMTKIRETTAKHLSYAWATIPHVTQHDKADVTELERLRKIFSKRVEEAGGKLTVTAILIKVIEFALKKFPQFNASVDVVKKEVIYKKYYNIGIAADTDRGLLVPVIKNVDKKNIVQISIELNELSKKARDRKLSLEEMQGGNFSISNLGGIGGTAFTPVVNSPEVTILGVSRSAMEPVYLDGEFKPRLMLPLSLSYDHRLIDGADAARFLRWVCEALEQPFLLSLEG